MAATPSVGWITSPVPLTHQQMVAVGGDQHRLQAAQDAVHAPVLGQLGRGARHVALEVLQLGLEALQQGEGVGRRAGEAGQHLAAVQPADLVGVALHDHVAERHLAVAADGHAAACGARPGSSSNGCGSRQLLLGRSRHCEPRPATRRTPSLGLRVTGQRGHGRPGGRSSPVAQSPVIMIENGHPSSKAAPQPFRGRQPAMFRTARWSARCRPCSPAGCGPRPRRRPPLRRGQGRGQASSSRRRSTRPTRPSARSSTSTRRTWSSRPSRRSRPTARRTTSKEDERASSSRSRARDRARDRGGQRRLRPDLQGARAHLQVEVGNETRRRRSRPRTGTKAEAVMDKFKEKNFDERLLDERRLRGDQAQRATWSRRRKRLAGSRAGRRRPPAARRRPRGGGGQWSGIWAGSASAWWCCWACGWCSG